MGEIQLLYRDVTLRTWEELSDPCESQEEILRWAFKPKRVCLLRRARCGNSAPRFATSDQAREHLDNLSSQPLQVQVGLTKAGGTLSQERDQVLERRFIMVEFDLRAFDWLDGFTRAAKLDYQARLHFHLSREFPLALIVFSGNESAHGWYATQAPS